MYWDTIHKPSEVDLHKLRQKEIGRLRNEITKAYKFINEAELEVKRIKAIIDQEP